MSSNLLQVPRLINTREFPEDPKALGRSLGRMYIDIANCVNNRTASIFPNNFPILNGETWFINSNQRFLGFRQVYQFTTTADIQLGFKINSVDAFVRLQGTYSDTTGNWYALAPATSTSASINGQLGFYVKTTVSTTSDVITFVADGAMPTLSNGIIILEWLSSV